MVLNEFDPREEPGRDPQEQVSGKLINFTVLRTSQYLAFLALVAHFIYRNWWL